MSYDSTSRRVEQNGPLQTPTWLINAERRPGLHEPITEGSVPLVKYNYSSDAAS